MEDQIEKFHVLINASQSKQSEKKQKCNYDLSQYANLTFG